MIRERTHTWHDSRELVAAGAPLSGPEFLSRIGRGELAVPPAVEASVTDARGRGIAQAVSTCLLIPEPS